MEDPRLRAHLFLMTPSRILYYVRGIAIGFAAVSQLAGQTTQTASAGDRASAYYHYTLGHMYAEQAGNKGDFLNKAIENLRLALKADPGATFISEELSDLYVQSGGSAKPCRMPKIRWSESVRHKRKAHSRPIYTRMIGDSQQGKVDENMLKKAIEQYSKIVEAEPKDIDTWLMLGRLYKIAQNSVEAEKAYQKVLDIDPDHEDALTGLAVVYADLGDSQRSSDLLKKLTAKNPSPRTLMALASQYEQMKDYASAAETLRKAMELQPDNAEIKRALAQNLLFADRYDDALKMYAEIGPTIPRIGSRSSASLRSTARRRIS